MKVLVTGGSGWIGSAVVRELIRAGHTVVGLARSDTSAKKLNSLGATVVHGDLEDLDAIRTASVDADGVIHCGFVYNSNFAKSCNIDRAVIETIGSALEGSNKPFVISSGALMLATTPSRMASESDTPDMRFNPGPLAIRAQTEQFVMGLAEKGVRSAVVRLPPCVHDEEDKGFMMSIIGLAKRRGVAGYIGSGENRWPSVHRLDAARLYVLAIEKAPPGSALHAVAEEGVRLKDIADVIGKGVGVPVETKSTEHFDHLATVIGIDAPTSATKTRKELGWEPQHRGLIADMARFYF